MQSGKAQQNVLFLKRLRYGRAAKFPALASPIVWSRTRIGTSKLVTSSGSYFVSCSMVNSLHGRHGHNFTYSLDLPPTQDSSHHQDDITCLSKGFQFQLKPSFACVGGYSSKISTDSAGKKTPWLQWTLFFSTRGQRSQTFRESPQVPETKDEKKKRLLQR